MRILLAMIAAAGLLAGPAEAPAQAWDLAGDIGAELRYFGDDPQWAGQADGLEASVALNLEARWRNEAGDQRASIMPFLRLDSADSERSHFDLREDGSLIWDAGKVNRCTNC